MGIEDWVDIGDGNLLESSLYLWRFNKNGGLGSTNWGVMRVIGDVVEGGLCDANHCYGWPLAKWHIRVKGFEGRVSLKIRRLFNSNGQYHLNWQVGPPRLPSPFQALGCQGWEAKG